MKNTNNINNNENKNINNNTSIDLSEMKIVSLITEYNPFHNGHLYHLKQAKKQCNATHSIAIMSGNFVQRGEPAIFDKFSRAKMAVNAGVDLVIELPSLFATQTAELFAFGSILTLDSLNCIDYLCFGSENGDISQVALIADILADEPKVFSDSLYELLKTEHSYPIARELAIKAQLEHSGFNLDIDISKPNNILGIEYLKFLFKLNSDIKPLTIKRKGSKHNSKDVNKIISSATSIRNGLKKKELYVDTLPKSTTEIIENLFNNHFKPMFAEYYFEQLITIILREKNRLDQYFDVKDGLEHSIYKHALKATSLNQLVISLTSKSYTEGRIKRCLMNILLDIKKDDLHRIKDLKSIPYIRVLALNKKGAQIINKIKANSNTHIITKLAQALDTDQYEFNRTFSKLLDNDIKSSTLYYNLYYKNNKQKINGEIEFTHSPYFFK